jgi:hypothetical protein
LSGDRSSSAASITPRASRICSMISTFPKLSPYIKFHPLIVTIDRVWENANGRKAIDTNQTDV